MKVIRDENMVKKLVKKEKTEDYFDTANLSFEIRQYEKGEIIASPSRPLESILFLAEGSVQIYGILSDGGKMSVSLMEKPTLLGDVEFCGNRRTYLFAEAMTEVTCLALPFERNKKKLDQDIKFLHVILHSLAEKMLFNSKNKVETPTLEKRVLFYLENVFEDHQFCGIEEAVARLRCSRRQLQRVLKKLCEENKVVRTGKGKYKLYI